MNFSELKKIQFDLVYNIKRVSEFEHPFQIKVIKLI